jgi:hypothetical protein
MIEVALPCGMFVLTMEITRKEDQRNKSIWCINLVYMSDDPKRFNFFLQSSKSLKVVNVLMFIDLKKS